MKKAPRTHILDRLHRGVVWTCIGLTIYGSFLLGRRVQRYFTVVKPRRDEEDMRMLREIEGAPVAAAIDPASLVDSASNLTS